MPIFLYINYIRYTILYLIIYTYIKVGTKTPDEKT